MRSNDTMQYTSWGDFGKQAVQSEISTSSIASGPSMYMYIQPLMVKGLVHTVYWKPNYESGWDWPWTVLSQHYYRLFFLQVHNWNHYYSCYYEYIIRHLCSVIVTYMADCCVNIPAESLITFSFTLQDVCVCVCVYVCVCVCVCVTVTVASSGTL